MKFSVDADHPQLETKQNSNASARQSGKKFVVVVLWEPRMWDWVLEIRG
jgi:hypothetical protein